MVLSGHQVAVEKAVQLAKEKKGVRRAISLEVSAPFHCRLMLPAAEAVARELESLTVKDPTVPIVSNVTATEVRVRHSLSSLLRSLSVSSFLSSA